MLSEAITVSAESTVALGSIIYLYITGVYTVTGTLRRSMWQLQYVSKVGLQVMGWASRKLPVGCIISHSSDMSVLCIQAELLIVGAIYFLSIVCLFFGVFFSLRQPAWWEGSTLLLACLYMSKMLNLSLIWLDNVVCLSPSWPRLCSVAWFTKQVSKFSGVKIQTLWREEAILFRTHPELDLWSCAIVSRLTLPIFHK
jgi:hypothetical protein